jgi:leader peptidase (prepilin peptidase)/N-methyltransferase
LGWLDLIPVFSFLLQKGRCRYCQGKISWQYPLVEIITGIVFVLVFLRITHYALLITYWLLFSFLIAISVYDIKHQIIPNKLIYPFILLAIGYWLLVERASVLFLLSGVAFGGFFALLWLFSCGQWMGFGDAKLALGLGFLLGPQNTVAAFLFSFWLGALIAFFLLILKGRIFTMKSKIPFGPFLATGSLLAFLIGERFIHLFLLL